MNNTFGPDHGLLINATHDNYELLVRHNRMLPFVLRSEWLDVTQLWIAESCSSQVAHTYVGLDEREPFKPYPGAKYLQAENVYVVLPNIAFVDYVCDELVDERALQVSKTLCNMVDNFEAVKLDYSNSKKIVDINNSLIRNRQCTAYTNCIQFLTSEDVQMNFASYLLEELSPHNRIEKTGILNPFTESLTTTETTTERHYWPLHILMEKQEQECFAIISADNGSVEFASKPCIDLFGLPSDPQAMKDKSPADYCPENQDCGGSSASLMLEGARKALINGTNRVSFTHYDSQGRKIECDIWQQRLGSFADMRVLGHIKRAVVKAGSVAC